jgi:hypothetical protein
LAALNWASATSRCSPSSCSTFNISSSCPTKEVSCLCASRVWPDAPGPNTATSRGVPAGSSTAQARRPAYETGRRRRQILRPATTPDRDYRAQPERVAARSPAAAPHSAGVKLPRSGEGAVLPLVPPSGDAHTSSWAPERTPETEGGRPS